MIREPLFRASTKHANWDQKKIKILKIIKKKHIKRIRRSINTQDEGLREAGEEDKGAKGIRTKQKEGRDKTEGGAHKVNSSILLGHLYINQKSICVVKYEIIYYILSSLNLNNFCII